MTNRKLTKAIMAGLMSGMAFFGTYGLPHAEAGTSLYDEYQASQRMRQQGRENVKEEGREKGDDKSASGKSGETGPSDFLDRIRAILQEGDPGISGHYERFLPQSYNYDEDEGDNKGDTKTEGDSDIGETVTVYEPVHETAHDPSKEMPSYEPPPPVASGTYSFNWNGTPIAQSLYALGSIAHKGVIVNASLNDKVYARLDNVTVNEALDYLSRAFDFNWMIDGNNIIISTNDKMKQSAVFEVSYANKDYLKEELKALGIDSANIYVNSESGTISVTATPYQIGEARKRMKEIDKPVAQCLLAAQLIEISHGNKLNLGLTYTLPSYSYSGSNTATSEAFHGPWWPKLSFGTTLQAERALSKGKVISRPVVLSKNGETAKVVFGDQVPIMSSTATSTSTNVTVSYKDVGTTLEVTPVINVKNGEISLKIHAEVSNITQYVTQGSTKAPEIATRNVDTTAHVKSGQSLIIGGLMSATDLDNLSGIPGLMNLPILGELFKFHNHSKTYAEVYIMLTPFIMDENVDAQALIRKVDQ